ncbi:hypothetical protein V498_04835 [Pseudogymnoascus sp. VKM F-4517 (FW-2822)]|nr:hypothetical protein V498_04835 [Pseudogymnoascus sp. VKM F-4517 (FW-2822)]
MAKIHREGATLLSESEGASGDQRHLNVIFVHGVRGHPRGTWSHPRPTSTAGRNDDTDARTDKHKNIKTFLGLKKSKKETDDKRQTSTSPLSDIFWPEEYLAPDLPQARIWTYGYNADVIGGLFQANNQNSVSQHGRDFAVRSETICKRTKLIVFLGTPHRGSTYAGWGVIASNLASIACQDSNKRLVQTLEVNDEVLDNIHEEFKTILVKRAIKVHSFQEAKGISGMKGLDSKVVDNFSSKLDLAREQETVETVDANHMEMARFRPALAKPFIVPFSQDEHFVSREDILNQLDLGGQQEAPKKHRRHALVGLGGVGKSQIAIKYAYQVQKHRPQISVFWIHASTKTRFEQAYQEMAERLELPGRDNPEANVLRLVYNWLSDEANGQWHIILDNVDDRSMFFGNNGVTTGVSQHDQVTDSQPPLESFLPQSRNGSILITSRNSTAADNLVGTLGKLVLVEPMKEKDSVNLLKTKIPVGKCSEADLKELAKALEDRARIADKTVWYLFLAGEYAAAEKIGRATITGRVEALGVEHSDTLTGLSNLRLVLQRQSKYKEAEAMHQRALEAREEVLGGEHPNTLTSLNNLRSLEQPWVGIGEAGQVQRGGSDALASSRSNREGARSRATRHANQLQQPWVGIGQAGQAQRGGGDTPASSRSKGEDAWSRAPQHAH